MKILWIIHGYPPVLNAGAELYTHNLNKYLISQGHQIKVFVPKKYSHYENSTMIYDGVNINALGEGERPDNLVEWSDIVMTHLDFTNMTIHYVNNNRPVVWVSHNTFFDAYKHLNENENVSIIYNSYAMKEIGDKIFSNRSFVLHPLISLKKKYSIKKPNPAGNKYITLINLNENKGGLLLKQLAEAMPSREFLGVIGGYDKQVEQPPNVKVVPHTSNIQEIYDQTRVILMPSYYESWGMVASEAMINGIPVIANRTFGLTENLGGAGIFCPLQVLKWKYAIRQLDTPCIYEAQSDKCLKRAEEQKEFNKLETRDCMFYLEMIIAQSEHEKLIKYNDSQRFK